MKKLSFLLVIWFCMASSSYGEKSCNELINVFFDYDEKAKIESALASSIKKRYSENPIGKIADDIAKDVSKEVVCSQAEARTKKIIERVLDLYQSELNTSSIKRDEYIKLIGKVVKGTCSKMDK